MEATEIRTKIKTNVQIKDGKTGEILVNASNAINNQNMAIAIARGLANEDSGLGTHQIYALALGNGGSFINSSNVITYLAPNVTGTAARLYHQTYFDVVDEQQSGTQSGNSVTNQPGGTDTTSIVIVTMTISGSEPTGQTTSDTAALPAFNGEFSFDELGLFTYGTNGTFSYTTVPTDSLMLTHLIFSPILKTSNRELIITYTLTISVS